jgi:hypothetical protein
MDGKLSENTHLPPVFVRAGLLFVLVASGTGIFFAVTWVYYQVLASLGLGIAQVVVAFLAILILFLILLGFGAGFSVDRFIRRRKLQALRFYRFLKKNLIFRSLWGYTAPHDETEKTFPTDQQHAAEMKVLLNRPKRRGRPPTYSIERWKRVVLAWENRDPLYNPMTLMEFLSLEFGTYADGSPRMSENSYYDWRKRVLEEVRKQEANEKKVTV